MIEIVIGAVLITVIAYTAGFFTGQYISKRRTDKLKILYLDAIDSAKYVSEVVNHAEQTRYYYDHPRDE